jgi:RNA polymerase sigma-70 factor (ECF subfamily)
MTLRLACQIADDTQASPELANAGIAMMEIAAPDMTALLSQARDGDTAAFGELCRVYENRLLGQALYLCGNQSLAEDLTQETLVAAWKGLRRYNGRCQFFTWLCAILLNRHRNTLRSRHVFPFSAFTEHEQIAFEDRLARTTDPRVSPDEATQRSERAALVQECLRALPAKQRQVIYLRFYVDDSLAGIAEALGCSVGTVKSRLFYALERLRSMSAMKEQ